MALGPPAEIPSNPTLPPAVLKKKHKRTAFSGSGNVTEIHGMKPTIKQWTWWNDKLYSEKRGKENIPLLQRKMSHTRHRFDLKGIGTKPFLIGVERNGTSIPIKKKEEESSSNEASFLTRDRTSLS